MADDTKLIALIEANTKQFENALKRIERSTAQTFGRADQSVRRLETSLRSSSAQLVSIGRTFATAFGAGILVGGFAQLPRLIGDVVHQAAGLVDLADKIGITTEALQELRFQADQNGSSAAALDAALEQFSKRIGLAAAGSGELLKILQANGIALRDNAGNLRPLNELLASYADLIKNAANDQDRAVLATEAFGRAGDEMSSVLRDGAEGMRVLGEEAHRTNQIVGDEGLRALESYDDRLAELSGKWSTFWTEATVVALTALEKIGQAEHFILDPIIAAINEGLTTDTEEAQQELKELETQIAFMRAHLEDDPINIRFNTAEIDNLLERAAELRSIIESGAVTATRTIRDLRTKDDLVTTPPPGQTTVIPQRGGGGRDTAADDIKRQKDAVLDLISDLEFERSLIGLTNEQREVEIALRRAGTVATDEQRAQIEALVASGIREQEALDSLIDKMDELRDAAGGALSAFNASIREGEGLAGGLKSALENVLSTVIRIAEQQAITSLFGKFGTAGGGGIGSIIGGLFGGAGANTAAPFSLPAAVTGLRPGGGGQAAVVRLVIDENEMFASRVVGISGAVAVQAVKSNNRAIPGMIADRRARGL